MVTQINIFKIYGKTKIFHANRIYVVKIATFLRDDKLKPQ